MNNSQQSSKDLGSPPSITLRIRNLGHVPAFKNHKLLTRGRLRTDPKKQRWMRAAEDVLAFELLSQYPTIEGETVTAQNLRFWIAAVMYADDCSRYLTACSWRFTSVPRGSEGAEIAIDHHNDASET